MFKTQSKKLIIINNNIRKIKVNPSIEEVKNQVKEHLEEARIEINKK